MGRSDDALTRPPSRSRCYIGISLIRPACYITIIPVTEIDQTCLQDHKPARSLTYTTLGPWH